MYRRIITFALFCAFLGAMVGLLVSSGAAGQGWRGLPFYAALSAGLTAMLFWWLFMERRNRVSTALGVLTGAFTGFIAHYPCWYFVILGQNVLYWWFGHAGSSLGEPPVDPLSGLGGAFALSFWSWLLVGWLTVIIGAAAGGVYAWHVGRQRGDG